MVLCAYFYFSRCLPLQKMFNHLVYNTYYIVDDIISCKWLINILFAVCKLSIRNLVEIVCKLNDAVCKVKRLLRLFASWMMLFARIYSANMFTCCCKDIIFVNDVYNLLRCVMWFINCKEVDWMFVNNDTNLLRIWLALLKDGQQVVWKW